VPLRALPPFPCFDNAHRETTSMRPVRVIIADESPAMRRWYAAALSRLAHDIEECEDGWQLLNRLAEDHPYDLVVASKWLPGFSGAQVVGMLRAPEARGPVVLVTPLDGGGGARAGA